MQLLSYNDYMHLPLCPRGGSGKRAYPCSHILIEGVETQTTPLCYGSFASDYHSYVTYGVHDVSGEREDNFSLCATHGTTYCAGKTKTAAIYTKLLPFLHSHTEPATITVATKCPPNSTPYTAIFISRTHNAGENCNMPST